ncbi:MAG: right-handed parallel beta-helix repeat-containing protein [Gemmatimonadaceae bacterium]
MVLPTRRSTSFPRGRGTAQWLPTPPPPLPPGNAFFVANAGSDSNPGTFAQPWQTLGHAAAARTWVGNDTLALKANDTFTGETLSLLGGGTFDATTYNTTLASVQASAQAAYLAGATFTGFFNAMVAAGLSAPDATTEATAYCVLLATRDAVRAAFDAADATSAWVRITRYGEGVNPRIAPGGAINVGISIDRSSVGGWKVSDVDVLNCQVSGIDWEPTAAGVGLWVERCRISNITGMPLPPGGVDNNPRVAGFFNAWAVPVGAELVSNVCLRNNRFETSDAGAFIWWGNDWLIDGNYQDSTKYQPITLIGNLPYPASSTQRCVLVGNTIYKQQALGWPNGTTGLQLVRLLNSVVDNCVITDTSASGDGTGIDFEAFLDRILVNNCRILNCQGSPIAMVASSSCTRSIISNNFYVNNGLQGVATNVGFCRSDPTTASCYSNHTTRAGTGTTQKLFSGTSHSFPPNVATDTPITGFTYGPDNVVSPP